jgi:valyl-tRNA synthetase
MKVGRRLAMKILNASKFALGVFCGGAPDGAVVNLLDQSMLGELHSLVSAASDAFEAYDYARALDATESFFWTFCDDYIELVKLRAYGTRSETEAASASAALATALSVLLRLFAPYLPFVTEEVWSWWQSGSVHRAPWPEKEELAEWSDVAVGTYRIASEVLGEIRKAKSVAKQSMRAEVARLIVHDTAARWHTLEPALPDVELAGGITGSVEFVESEDFRVEVELAASDAA